MYPSECAPSFRRSKSCHRRTHWGRRRMRQPLTIAVAQPLCVPHDVEVNAVTHAATVRSAGTRAVVFPELSLTGYELDAPAITVEDSRLAPLVATCAETGSLA